MNAIENIIDKYMRSCSSLLRSFYGDNWETHVVGPHMKQAIVETLKDLLVMAHDEDTGNWEIYFKEAKPAVDAYKLLETKMTLLELIQLFPDYFKPLFVMFKPGFFNELFQFYGDALMSLEMHQTLEEILTRVQASSTNFEEAERILNAVRPRFITCLKAHEIGIGGSWACFDIDLK